VRMIIAAVLLATASVANADMKIGKVKICTYQRVNAEQMFDALQKGVPPDSVRATQLAANERVLGDATQAKLAVDLPFAFLKANKLLSKPAAAELVYLSCDAASRRQHSEALVTYLHESGERCQTQHASDKKADRKISACMRKAYEAFEPTPAGSTPPTGP
jgi:hypothetical protein